MQAFLAVAPCIAQHANYHEVLVEELLHVKLRHWEVEMRQLAARGLGVLLEAASDLNMAPKLIESLLDFCSHDALEACLLDLSLRAGWCAGFSNSVSRAGPTWRHHWARPNPTDLK